MKKNTTVNIDEDVRLRTDKENIIDLAINQTEKERNELMQVFLPKKTKRIILSSKQFEQLIHFILIKNKNIT